MTEVKKKDLQEGTLGQERHTSLETSSLQIRFLLINCALPSLTETYFHSATICYVLLLGFLLPLYKIDNKHGGDLLKFKRANLCCLIELTQAEIAAL